MGRKRFAGMNCGVAQALDVVGDWWTLLIVREAFLGTNRFVDFRDNLGISKGILTDRLDALLERGIFESVDVGQTGERYEYRLTEKGEDLLVVLTALREWGERWVLGRGKEPTIVRDRKTGKRVPPLFLRSAEGRVLRARDLRAEPGPGASAETERYFRSRRGRREKRARLL